jgi:cell division protein ZapA (FtsZ GTPase activity inhibitor)
MSADKFDPVTVRIAGEDHTIRANVEPEYTRKCARLVDDRIFEIRSKAQFLETHRAAILAALSIAGDYYQALDDVERARRDTARRIDKLARRLEESMGLAEEDRSAASGKS